MWWSSMSIQRKISIGLVLFLSMLILWFQFRQREVISKLPSNVEEAQNMKRQWDLMAQNGHIEPLPARNNRVFSATQEGFGIFTSKETDMANELAKVSTPLGGEGTIRTYNVKTIGDLPVKEFIIKSAFNAACTGNYMNTDMIKYVLSRGCRLLDFQLYYDTNTQNVMVSSLFIKAVRRLKKFLRLVIY